MAQYDSEGDLEWNPPEELLPNQVLPDKIPLMNENKTLDLIESPVA